MNGLRRLSAIGLLVFVCMSEGCDMGKMPTHLKNIVAISAGWNYTCALTNGGGVKCWGSNTHGQLGNGFTNDSLRQVDVVGLTSGVIAITAGREHTCALTSGGGVKCWGTDWHGELGNGDANQVNYSTIPVDVLGLGSGVVAIASGAYHSCALLSGGGVKCWGDNEVGQLGIGWGHNDTNAPDYYVNGLANGVNKISAGANHTCAITTGGGIKCWGNNEFGQLGNNTNTPSGVPVDVSGLASGIVDLASGNGHTCAITSNGGVKCWGEGNLGQLGDGTTLNRWTPIDVWNLSSGATSISVGLLHTCVVMSGGGVKCWGDNSEGQLGDGGTTQQLRPVDVSGLSYSVTMVAGGMHHTCALLTIGEVMCWGDGTSGQLGNHGNVQYLAPVPVLE